MREQALFQAGNEHVVEFQALGRVHRHHLQRILARLRLVIPGFQRCVRQEGGEGRHDGRQRRVRVENLDAILVDDGCARLRLGGWPQMGRCRLAETFLGNELAGRADHLLQILDAVGAFFFILIMLQQGTRFQHHSDHFRQRQLLRFETHAFDQFHEAGQHAARLARHVGHGRIQRDAVLFRRCLQLLDRAHADAPRGEINHAQESGVIVRIVHQLQIGNRVLDLGALEVALATVHVVRNAG